MTNDHPRDRKSILTRPDMAEINKTTTGVDMSESERQREAFALSMASIAQAAKFAESMVRLAQAADNASRATGAYVQALMRAGDTVFSVSSNASADETTEDHVAAGSRIAVASRDPVGFALSRFTPNVAIAGHHEDSSGAASSAPTVHAGRGATTPAVGVVCTRKYCYKTPIGSHKQCDFHNKISRDYYWRKVANSQVGTARDAQEATAATTALSPAAASDSSPEVTPAASPVVTPAAAQVITTAAPAAPAAPASPAAPAAGN